MNADDMMRKLGHFELAVWTYNRFRMKFPNVKPRGLYHVPRVGFSILVERLTDYESVQREFDHAIRPIILNINIVAQLDESNATLMPPLSLEQEFNLVGNPRTLSQLRHDLDINLPLDFPGYKVSFDHVVYRYTIATYSELSLEQKRTITDAFSRIIPGQELSFHVDTAVFEQGAIESDSKHSLALHTAREIQRAVPSLLSLKVKEDEGTWVEFVEGRKKFQLEYQPAQAGASCIIDVNFSEIDNIRPYLTLFNHLYIVAPFVGDEEEFFQSLAIKKPELIKLISVGVVSILVPGDVTRYNIELLTDFSDAGRVIFSRELAVMSMLETNSRIPFLNAANSFDERIALLQLLRELSRDLKSEASRIYFDEWDVPVDFRTLQILSSFFNNLCNSLSSIYMDDLDVYNSRGAMGSFGFGFGRVVSDFVKAATNLDYSLELGYSSALVEWSGCLGSGFISGRDGVTGADKNEFVASFYSGARGGLPVYGPQVSTVAEDILCLHGSEPVDLLVEAFNEPQVARFRQLCIRLASENVEADQFERALLEFNETVRQVERNQRRLAASHISSLYQVLGAGGALASGEAAPLVLSVGEWVYKVLDSLTCDNHKYDHAKDVISAMNHRVNSSSILIYRMRQRLNS